MRSAATLPLVLLALLSFDRPAAGQASVEYGAGAAGSSGAAGAFKGLGDTINAALGNADKTVKSSSDPVPTRTVPAPAKKSARPGPKATPAPPPSYEDPRQIEVGMQYEELRRRFGPPLMEVTDGSSRTLSYMSKEGPVQVEFSDDKVTSTQKPKS